MAESIASKIKLTKSRVDAIAFTGAGQKLYWDKDLKGFGLRVGSESKCYIAQAKVRGRTVRVTIGRHGIFTPDTARREAREQLYRMAKGANPNRDNDVAAQEAVTVEQAFEEFLTARKSLKWRTIEQYRYVLNVYLGDWKTKPLLQVSRDMIAARHIELGKRSPAQANLAMRFLRSLLNFAAGRYQESNGNPIFLDNPVKRLSQTKAWFRVERRQTYIKPTDLTRWFAAVLDLTQSGTSRAGSDRKRKIVRDYFLLLLFTGLRKQEAATLRWADVNFSAKTLTVRETKNREPHTLPLSDFLIELLTSRRTDSPGEFVFPGQGASGHLVEVTQQMKLVIKKSGVAFALHDLRRTFTTIAESLDLTAYCVKRLLNHKMTNDVTAGYIVPDVERLREPMRKISDFILKTSNVRLPSSAHAN